MYKLFLCLRYLRSKVFAYFGMLAMSLVVMLMLTSVSIFSGFLHKIEVAAKGLFGDIVIESSSARGVGFYDEFMALTAGGEFKLPSNQAGVDPKTGNLRMMLDSQTAGLLALSQDNTSQQVFPVTLQLTHVDEKGKPLPKLPPFTITGKAKLGEVIIPTKPSTTGRPVSPHKIKVLEIKPDKSHSKTAKFLINKRLLATGKISIKKAVAELEAADPFILTLGMISIAENENFYQHVQIAGIRLPQRTRVSDFENGMLVQTDGKPTFDPSLKKVKQSLQSYQSEIRELIRREFATQLATIPAKNRSEGIRNWGKPLGEITMPTNPSQPIPWKWPNLSSAIYQKPMTPEQTALLNQLDNAHIWQQEAMQDINRAISMLPEIKKLQAELVDARDKGASETELSDIQDELDDLTAAAKFELPESRAILGYGMPGLTQITPTGEAIRFIGPGKRIILHIGQLGKKISTTSTPLAKRVFYVIDENRSGVSSIDRKLVYVPFDTLQKVNNMAAEYNENGYLLSPARTSQLHFKVIPGKDDEQSLMQVASKIRGLWQKFSRIYPSAGGSAVGIQTWRQRQHDVISPIENQRSLLVFFGGLFSIVLPTLIFVIFYTIVSQKIREIGLLKSLGASSRGIAGIFLSYGFIVGLFGGLIGITAAYYITVNINNIQDWIAEVTGVRVWNAKVFMFDKIPNEVDWNAATYILIGAVVSGILGALWPAIRAAVMRPIKALRYE